MNDIVGKKIVITGAAGLIGNHFCNILSEVGANVVGVDIKCLNDVSSKNNNTNDSIVRRMCDVTSVESLNDLRGWLLDRYGYIDCIINAAAIDDKVENVDSGDIEGQFEIFPLADWKKSVEIGLTGTFLVCQTLSPIIGCEKGGSIVNICSTYGMVGPRQDLYIDKNGKRLKFKNPAYPAVKGAILNFTRYLASYLGDQHIRVNCISPGGVENGQSDWFISNYSSNTPLGRMARLDDFNGMIKYLCSDDSKYSTGANYVIDGGYTAI